MKISNILKAMAVAGLAAGMMSCSKVDPEETLIDGKYPIRLSSNLDTKATAAVTRALHGFDEDTKIAIRVVAGCDNVATPKYAKTTATVKKKKTADATESAVTFTSSEYLFWDDMYGRDSKLDIYAIGVPCKSSGYTNSNSPLFSDTDTDNSVTWTLSTTQTAATYAAEDLVISNNIKSGDTDERLVYKNGAFQKGHLTFFHANSKIRVNLKKGNGFGTGSFNTVSVTANGFYNTGKYDAATGAATVSGNTADISTYEVTAASGYEKSYECLVISSRNWETNSKALSISVDGNVYYVNTNDFNTSSSASSKLTGNMLANNEYVFNIVVNKSDVEVTASIVDWDSKSTSVAPVIINTGNIGNVYADGQEITGFCLYRSTSVDNGYDEDATASGVQYATKVSKATSGWSYSPAIYWPDHTTEHYFRALSQLDEDGALMTQDVTVTNADSKDYVSVATCTTTSGSSVKAGTDICLGAPYEIDESGNLTALTGAKKAENGTINLTFKHKMAEVFVQLLTSDGTDSVSFADAKVEILNSFTTGKLMLGTTTFSNLANKADYSMGDKCEGLLQLPGEDKQTTAIKNVFRCYAIPQALTDSGKKIQLKITAAGNTYFADADKIGVSGWAEGCRYLYKITITKTEVELTASLVDWDSNAKVELGIKL